MTTPPLERKAKITPARRRTIVRAAAWTAAGIALLLVLVVGTVAVLLHNARFHAYVLRTVETKAGDALGVPVRLRDFNLNLGTLSVDLYGLDVAGASPYANPSLLTVEHAQAGVRIVSVFGAKWYLDSVRVDKPIVHLFVDANGISNLPKFNSTGQSSSSSTSIFDLGIRHAVLTQGEAYYNDKQSALAADLHDVEFRAAFDALLKKYSGHLSYADGHLYSGSYQPIPHTLDAEFDATPTVFHLTSAKLSSGASQVVVSATMSNYAQPMVDAKYDVLVDGGQVAGILKNTQIPSGQVRITGAAHYAQTPNRAPLDSLTVNGEIASRQLQVKTPSMRALVDNLQGSYTLSNGDFALKELHANLLGGYLTATGTVQQLSGTAKARMETELRNVSLAALHGALGKTAATPGVAVTGRVNLKANATWQKAFDDLVAQADTTLAGQLAGTKGQGSVVPLNSQIHGRYTGRDGTVTLTNSYLRTEQTNLTMQGTVSRRSSLQVRLQAEDLRELETIADLFRVPAPGQTLQPLGLAGTASLDATVQGSVAAPQVAGHLQATNLHVAGSAWKIVRADLTGNPSQVQLRNGDFEPEGQGKIGLNASVGLTRWSFSKTSPLQVDLNAAQLSIGDLLKTAGQQQMPVVGTLNASLNLHGTEMNPVGNGNLSITKAIAYDQPVSAIKLVFQGTGSEAHTDLVLQTPAGNLSGHASVCPQERTYTAQLTTDGIRLDELKALSVHNVNAKGTLTVNASGQGSFDNPQAAVLIQTSQLLVEGQTISDLKLQANLADHIAKAVLNSSAIGTRIDASATVNLTGDYMADAKIDTQAIPFKPLLAVYAPEQADSVSGETELHATLHGPLKAKNALEAHLTIPVLKVGYNNNIQLAATAPVRVDYVNGVVTLQHSSIKGTDTDLSFEGKVPVANPGALAVKAQGTVNLQLAQLFDPDIKTSGQVKFNLNSNSSSDYGGEIKIVNANFLSVDAPVGLQHGNGTLTLTRGRLNVTEFQGRVGGGTLTAQGGINLQPKLNFDLGVSAQGLRMLYPQGVRESVDAQIRLTGTTENALLGGTVDLSDISFTPAFDLNTLIGQLTGGVESPPSAGFAQNLRLNLAVRSTNEIALASRTLSVGGSANLQVRGTAANPVILGRINLTNGDIILNGDRFLLDGGTIAFVNPSETEPVVNVSIKTTIQQYDIYLRFNGPVSQLKTNYSSEPALPAADIINLLAFGQTTEASAQSGQDTTANQQAAGLIASQVSSQVTSRVSKIAGISQLSISPVLGNSSSGTQSGANITVQQRVTGNLFVTFSDDVNLGQTIQGQYQISPKVAVSATRSPNGGFAFDALIKKSW
jgi:translocation and assembly module TamB